MISHHLLSIPLETQLQQAVTQDHIATTQMQDLKVLIQRVDA
jgi:hypothetical protein